MTESAYERLVSALGENIARSNGHVASARCPAHDDRSPSLSVRGIEGQALLYCHAGCDTADVLDALGMASRDLFDNPRETSYRYDDGRLVFRTPDKKFRQSGNTKGTGSLYRLSRVVEAVRSDRTVYVVEGEKDVHALESLDAVATCSPMGAGKWPKVDPTPLYGGKVVVVADNDEPGRQHAREVLASLDGHVQMASVVRAKAGKDAADHVAAGHGLEDFEPLEPEPERPPRRVRLTPASTITPRPVRWTWDTADPDAPPSQRQGRIPEGSLVLAAGRAGLGKSQFAVWLAARITTGTLPGALYGRPRAVVYAAAEDSWAMTIVPRLLAAGADLNLVFRVDVESDDDPHARLTLPVDTSLLERALEEYSVALVVMDPLLSLIDSGINDYRAREVRLALEPLVAVADRTRATFLGLAHFTKATGSDPLLLISGSGAFGQLIRAGLGFARDDDSDDGSCVMSTIKNNLGREDLPSLSYVITPCPVATPAGETWVSRLDFTGEESERSVRDLLADRGGDPEERTERDEAVDWLKAHLADEGGEASAGDVIKAAARDGIAKTTLTRARYRAGVTSRKAGMGAGWVWSIDPNALTEESTKNPKGPHIQSVGSSVPSVDSSTATHCQMCGQEFMITAPDKTHCERCKLARPKEIPA